MVCEPRKQSMAWMEQGLQISLQRYALSMEDKMAAGTLDALGIMGETFPLVRCIVYFKLALCHRFYAIICLCDRQVIQRTKTGYGKKSRSTPRRSSALASKRLLGRTTRQTSLLMISVSRPVATMAAPQPHLPDQQSAKPQSITARQMTCVLTNIGYVTAAKTAQTEPKRWAV